MVFTRRSNSLPSSFTDPEIEHTLARIRKEKQVRIEKVDEREDPTPLTMSEIGRAHV